MYFMAILSNPDCYIRGCEVAQGLLCDWSLSFVVFRPVTVFLQKKCHRFFYGFCKKNGDICKNNGDFCKKNGDICKQNGDICKKTVTIQFVTVLVYDLYLDGF